VPCLLSADEAASAKEYKRAEVEGHGRDAYVHTNTLDWSENIRASRWMEGRRRRRKPLEAVIDGGP